MARLITFRDLWRKGISYKFSANLLFMKPLTKYLGFYLTSGEKFGCNYLAYEKPPGDGHSRF